MNEIVIALITAVPAFLIGVFAYRRSLKVDQVSAQSGAASNQMAGTAQVIEGLNRLIDQLQEDNDSFRADIKDLAARLVVITAERDALKLEVARLRKKYAANGDDPA